MEKFYPPCIRCLQTRHREATPLLLFKTFPQAPAILSHPVDPLPNALFLVFSLFFFFFLFLSGVTPFNGACSGPPHFFSFARTLFNSYVRVNLPRWLKVFPPTIPSCGQNSAAGFSALKGVTPSFPPPVCCVFFFILPPRLGTFSLWKPYGFLPLSKNRVVEGLRPPPPPFPAIGCILEPRSLFFSF